MGLTERDTAVLQLLGTFGQATATQIRSVLFVGLDPMAFSHSVGRLLPDDYLIRLGRYGTSERGGSPPYVYALGKRGRWLVGKEGRISREIRPHALKVCQVYVQLKEAERGGALTILDLALEVPVAHGIRGDMKLAVGVETTGRRLKFLYYLEVDRGTAGRKRITDKLAAYWHDFSHASGTYPYVAFVVDDGYRAAAIRRYIQERQVEQELFHVFELGHLVDGLLSFARLSLYF